MLIQRLYYSQDKQCEMIKFIYFEKATKFWKIFALILTGTTKDKSKMEILQNFVAFSEYMSFNYL